MALGAGNQAFLMVSDVLHQLFVEGCVVALKYHPLMVSTFLSGVATMFLFMDWGNMREGALGLAWVASVLNECEVIDPKQTY